MLAIRMRCGKLICGNGRHIIYLGDEKVTEELSYTQRLLSWEYCINNRTQSNWKSIINRKWNAKK